MSEPWCESYKEYVGTLDGPELLHELIKVIKGSHVFFHLDEVARNQWKEEYLTELLETCLQDFHV